jgi:integrase
VGGKPERVKIGPYPDWSIENARAEAHKMNASIAQGGNPAHARRSLRAEDTLGSLWERYFDEYAKHKRTAKKIAGMYRLYLHGFQLRKLSSITHSDVVQLHSRISRTRGPIVANRGVELLSSMFRQAQERWDWKGENPAAKVKANPETKRKRFLQANELPAFFEALAAEQNETLRDYFWVSLLTGARRSNVCAMRWNELNWARAEWYIPEEKAKAGEEIAVVLTPTVLDILARRKAESLRACSEDGSEPSPWVFAGRGRAGHLVEPKSAWKRILTRAQLTDLRLHDLRRTLGSWQAITGASLLVIGQSLGHSSAQSTQVYARLTNDPVRISVGRATVAMLTAGGVAGLFGGEK